MNTIPYSHSNEIVAALQNYQRETHGNSPYDDVITEYLTEFFQKLDWPTEKAYLDICDIGAYRDKLLLHAIMLFEDSSSEWVASYRKRYLAIDNNMAADKTGIYSEDCSIVSSLLRHQFVTIMKEAMSDRNADYSLIDGVWYAIEVYYVKFIEKIYIGHDMYKTIKNSKIRGIGGKFGKTKLLTWECAGRIVLTFSRNDKSITFVQSGDDPFALGAGIQSCSATVVEAINMIEDVIANYDPEKFKEDRNIYMV